MYKKGGTCTKRGGIYRKMFQKGGHEPAVPPPKSATAPGNNSTLGYSVVHQMLWINLASLVLLTMVYYGISTQTI